MMMRDTLYMLKWGWCDKGNIVSVGNDSGGGGGGSGGVSDGGGVQIVQ